MAIDVSTLAIEIKSQGISEANNSLKSLARSAEGADNSVGKLNKSASVMAQSLITALTAINNLNKSSAALSVSLSSSTQSFTQAAMSSSQLNSSLANITSLMGSMQSTMSNMSNSLTSIAKSSKEASDALNTLGNSVNQAGQAKKTAAGHGNILNNTFKSMMVAASAYIGINFAKSLVEQADAWGAMQAKLTIATGSIEGAVVAQQALFEVSQKLRIPLADSVQLFNRMSVPMMNMGKSTKDTMSVVEGMGMALKLSGATAQEASSVMLQFSQSMNSGRLNGAEFNAVAEGAPIILRAIETELRRTGQGSELATKGLKKMASEGLLTGEVISEAIIRARSSMEKDFNALPVTVDGAVQRIKNSWEKAIGDAVKNSNFNAELVKTLNNLDEMLPRIAENIAKALLFVTSNLETIIKLVSTLGGAAILGGLGNLTTKILDVASAVNKAETLTKAFTVASAALGLTPLGAAFIAVGAAIAGVVYIYNKLNQATEEAKKKRDEIINATPSILKAMDAESNSLKKQIDLLREKNGLQSKYKEDNSSKMSATFEDLSGEQKAMANLRRAKDELAIQEDRRNAYKKKYGSDYYYEGKRTLQDAKSLVTTLESQVAPIKKRLEAQQALRVEMQEQADKAKNSDISSKIRDVTQSKDEKEADKLQKILDMAKKRNDETGKAVIPLSEIAALEKKINELRSDDKPRISTKVQLDYLEKANAAYKEQLEKLKELTGVQGDGKRTSSEKEVVVLQERLEKVKSMTAAQAEAANVDKASEIALLDKAIAVRKLTADLESQNLVQEKYRTMVKEATSRSETQAKDAETEAERHRKLSEAVGKAADEFARLSYEKAQYDLGEMKAFGSAGFEDIIRNQERLVAAKKKTWEYTVEENREKSKKSVAETLARVKDNPILQDTAKKEQIRLQAKKDEETIQNAYTESDPIITSEQARADAIKEIHIKLAEDLNNIDNARVQVQLTSAESIAGSLASIAANTAGKQSGIYKVMFAAQKGFAIAKAMLDLQMALSSDSWALPFPGNLAIMAKTAAAGAALISNITSIGYEKGGYTGDYGTSEVAGVVHGQEFVVNANGTQKHRALLEAINAGKDPAMIDNVINMTPPTSVSSSNGGMNVKVENYGTSIQTEQISPNEIRIIARQEASKTVRKEAGNVVSAAIAAPNSNVSKALGRNTQTQRRRN